MTYDRLTIERHDYLLLIGFEPAARLNDVETLRQLARALSHLENAECLRCAVLFANRVDFAPALDDTSELSGVPNGSRHWLENVDPFEVRDRMRIKPVICAIQGRSDARGTRLALAQDAVIASEDAVLTMAGRNVPAEEALRFGIVQEVVPAQTQLRRAYDVAAALGARRDHRVEAHRAPACRRVEDVPGRSHDARSGWG